MSWHNKQIANTKNKKKKDGGNMQNQTDHNKQTQTETPLMDT